MIDVTIKTLDSQNHAFSVEDDTTVAQFKEKIAEVINIPVDSQRLIYCGRVLQDNKKLQEYDVHGKVVHLVQRAPPSTTRRARSPPPTNTTRRPFPGFNGSANAMYLGSMAFPSGLMEAQGIVPPPPTQSLSGSRLNVAKRMLRRAENILNHLEDPQGSRNRDSPPEEPQDEVTPVIAAQVFVPESAADDPIASLSAAVSAVENDILQRENGEVVVSADLSLPEFVPQAPEQGATSSSMDDAQPTDATSTSGVEPGLSSSSSNAEQMSSTSAEASANGSTTRPSVSVAGSGRLPENSSGTIEMARLLDELNTVHTRLRPFMERYHTFMRTDPAVNSDQVPTARETQTLINRVSEVMHLLGHAYHSLSDVMVQVSAAPPRPLLCRPILIQHSAVLQAGIPIQVEAQINLTSNRRPGDANSNAQQQSGAGEQVPASDNGSTAPTTGTTPTPPPPPPPPPQQPPTPGIHIRPNLHEIRFDSFPIEVRGFAGPRIISLGDPQVRRNTTQAPGTAPTSGSTFTTSTPMTNRTQPATSTDQNARSQFDGINPSNMEFFMEVTPESITIDSLGAAVVAPGPGENVVRGAFASAPPELIHSILQAVAGQMVGAGAPPPQQVPSAQAQQQQQQPSSTGSSTGAGTDTPMADTAQPCTVTQTSGAANGTNVNSQARGNTQTHPTTATQTRSTSRPHVHLAQHTMQGFDPFLPCNSHHIRHRRRPVPTSNAANANATTTDASTTTTNATGDQAQNNQQQSPVYNFLQGLLRTISTATRQQGREQPPQPQQQQQESQQTASATTQAADQSTTQVNNTTLPPFSTFLSSNSGTQSSTASPIFVLRRLVTDIFQDFRQLQMRLLGQRGTGQGVTLATLLNNFPEYTEGESIFNDLIMTLAGELTFGDIVAINSGNFESLTRIRPTLRTFFADRVLQGENPTQDAVERATERLINELQPTLEIMGTMRVRDNIDIVESMSRLCRSRFLVIISLIMSQGSPANLMDQCILTVRQLCMLALHCSENGQPGVEEVFKALIGRYTEGVSQDIHQWTVNASLAQFREFMRALDVPVANITPYIATRSTSENKPETNSTSESEPQPMECEPVRMTETVVQPVQIPAAEALIDTEPLPNVLIGSEPWHRELPADWIPIITRDTQRQRRQNPQPPFSDAYLSGMPSKRRKVVSNAKSQTSISQAVSDGVRTAVTTVGLQTAVPLDVVTQAASNDANLRTAYSDLLRSTVVPGVIRNPDFTPERFPNLAKYFDIKKE